MESLENYRPSNAFLAYLNDCINRPKVAEPKEEVSTIDGDIISLGAMKKALQAGKGVMIGGFFVGSTGSSDMEFGYSLSIYAVISPFFIIPLRVKKGNPSGCLFTFS